MAAETVELHKLKVLGPGPGPGLGVGASWTFLGTGFEWMAYAFRSCSPTKLFGEFPGSPRIFCAFLLPPYLIAHFSSWLCCIFTCYFDSLVSCVACHASSPGRVDTFNLFSSP